MSYADKLKQSAAASLGYLDSDYIEFCDHLKQKGIIEFYFQGEDKEVEEPGWSLSGRQYLQYFGTEGHRLVFGEDFWVDALMDEISSLATSYENDVFFITDIRYNNEAQEILDNNLGTIIEIQRPNYSVDIDTHASEQPISRDLVKHIIINDGTLDDLKLQARELLKELI